MEPRSAKPHEPGQRQRRSRSLRSYLFGLVVLFVLAASAGVWFAWAQAKRDALAGAAGDAAHGAHLAAGRIGADVALVQGTVRQVAANPGIGHVFDQPQDCSLSFAPPGGGDGGHLDLIRTDGSVACSSRPVRAGELGYALAPWWARALRGPVLAVPEPDARTGRQVLLATEPVPGRGVAAAFVDLDALASSVAETFGGRAGWSS